MALWSRIAPLHSRSAGCIPGDTRRDDRKPDHQPAILGSPDLWAHDNWHGGAFSLIRIADGLASGTATSDEELADDVV